MSNENGRTVLYWLMGAVLTLSTSGAAWTIQTYNARMLALELAVPVVAQRSFVNQEKIEALKESLHRIESKLDEVLQERRVRRGSP